MHYYKTHLKNATRQQSVTALMLTNILLAMLITNMIVDMPTLPDNVANTYISPVEYFVAIGSTLVQQLVTYCNFRDGAFKFAF